MLNKPKVGEIWRYCQRTVEGSEDFENCYIILSINVGNIDLCSLEQLIKIREYPMSSFDSRAWSKLC